MWLSSFAASAAEQLAVRARVWSANDAALEHADDVLSLVATSDVALLRRVRVVHDSFVTLSFQGRSHVARLRLQSTVESSQEDAEDVILSPLLAFNLGVPLHSSMGYVRVSVSP
jgi:hypothetical protein